MKAVAWPLLLLLLPAVSSSAAGTHPVTGEPLADEQVFTYRVLDEHTSVDPQLVEDVSGSEVVRDLFEGLLNQDADGGLVPGVALRFDSNGARDEYVFHLRRDARWSDGRPVTASDFEYAWRRAADPATASPYAWYMQLMALENVDAVMSGELPPETLGVEAVDDHTLRVRLSASLAYFPQMVTHATTFPAPRWAIEAHGEAWTRPGNIVSNGAYVLTEHVPQERLVRERNPMYWNDGATIIERVVSLVINDENVALTRYLAGELDRTEVPSGQYPRLREEYPAHARSFPMLCNYYYVLNLSPSGPAALADRRVRQALSYAIDREVITGKILRGGQFPAYTFTPGATAGFEVPDVPYALLDQPARDHRARELLAEAGVAGADIELRLLYNTSEGHRKIAIAVSQMWKQKLGITVTLENLEWKTFVDARGRQDFDIARGSWCGDYNEASTFLDLLTSQSGYNDGRFSNAEVDRLMLEARGLEDSAASYAAVEQVLAEEMPVIPLYHYAAVYMLNPALRNWPFDNVQQAWYAKDLYKVAGADDR